jgi:hypothetical protein
MLAIVEHQQELLRGDRIRDAFGRYTSSASSRPSAVAMVVGTRSGSENGVWRSKLGIQQLIEHQLVGLEGNSYGQVAAYFRRAKEAPDSN